MKQNNLSAESDSSPANLHFLITAVLALLGAVITWSPAGAQTIDTFTGGGSPAPPNSISGVQRVAVASDGTIYYTATPVTNQVFMLPTNGSGSSTLVAGNGLWGATGIDGGPATKTALAPITNLKVDSSGNLLIMEVTGDLRRVDLKTGIISTIAGCFENSPCPNAPVYPFPPPFDPGTKGVSDAQVDSQGNFLVSATMSIPDPNVVIPGLQDISGRIFRLDAQGNVTLIAGSGAARNYQPIGSTSPDLGPAISAALASVNSPLQDPQGNIYFIEGHEVVRRIDAITGLVTPFAGKYSINNIGGVGAAAAPLNGDGGPGKDAILGYITDIALDSSGNLLIADNGYPSIRKIDAQTGVITTVAGTGRQGNSIDGVQATTAALFSPWGIAFDVSGNLLIADQTRLRRVDKSGVLTTLVGTGVGPSGEGGLATDVQITYSTGVAVDAAGNVIITESNGAPVLRVAADSKLVTLVAGNGFRGYSGDSGLATNASVNPYSSAVAPNGDVIIADRYNNVVRRVDVRTGIISTIAGVYQHSSYSGDGGPASQATLAQPSAVAVDNAGNIYIADTYNYRVRKIDTNGYISLVAGNGTYGYSGDGGLAVNAALAFPVGIALDSDGNLFIADAGNQRVRVVDTTSNVITTYAGDGTTAVSGNNVPATSVDLSNPWGVAVDSAGNLFIAENTGNRVRRVDRQSKLITLVAGIGSEGFSGDGGPAVQAALDGPTGVAVDASGNLYIADYGNARIRIVHSPAADQPPVITPTVTGKMGNNGWYTSDVSVSWAVTDPNGTITSQTGCGASAITTDTSGLAITCTATSSGGTNTQTVTVKRDATPPTANVVVAPFPNGNGWNAGPVSVTFAGSDPLSGVASCSAPVTVSTDGANQNSPAGTCIDNAGNVSAPVTATHINIDTTKPTISAQRSPNPNGAGWNNTAVTITFAANDALSGVDLNGCTPAVTLNADGAGQSVAGTCADRAGNSASTTVSGINIDRTPPIAAGTASPAPNATGWNNTNVAVSFSGTDSFTGSGVASCTPGTTLNNEGAGQNIPGSCTDVAGNVSQGVTLAVNIDKTPPTVVITSPAAGASFPQGAQELAAYSCTDALSGAAACTGTVASGAAIPTDTQGAHSFIVTGADKAGNAATANVTYMVTAPVQQAPQITPLAVGTLGQNGWYTSDVALSWTIVSSAKFSSSGCGQKLLQGNTVGRTFTCTATNASGSTTASVTIKIDATPPTVRASVKPAANANDWRHEPVTVTFLGTDSQSGIVSCTSPIVLNEGATQGAEGTCVNGSGLRSDPVSVTDINVDLTPPSVFITTPADGAIYARGSVVLAEFQCQDSLSGIIACNGTVESGQRLNTNSRGTRTFTVSARDAAGNITKQQYTYAVQ